MIPKGDDFRINVLNWLWDTTMNITTSVVSIAYLFSAL